MLTTSSDDRDKTAAYELNVAGYLVKSKADDDFLVQLIGMLDDYCRIVELPSAKRGWREHAKEYSRSKMTSQKREGVTEESACLDTHDVSQRGGCL